LCGDEGKVSYTLIFAFRITSLTRIAAERNIFRLFLNKKVELKIKVGKKFAKNICF
jgi:hypothetical protein